MQIDVFLDTVRPDVYNPQALAKDHPSLQKVRTFVAGPHTNLDDTLCAVPECLEHWPSGGWHPPVCVLFCCTYVHNYSTYRQFM